jgi:thiamine pyrophosphate-dependent acetolactate synthase large subunit-like protein
MRTNSGELNVGEATIKLLEQYGLKQIQDDMKARDINLVGVDGVNPDFVMLAQSCGCHGMTIDSAVKLREAVSNAFKADRPTLIEIRESDPWLQ